MKPIVSLVAARPLQFSHLSFSPAVRQLANRRSYATQPGGGPSTPSSKRRAVTPFNDDGNIAWSDLSAGEKTGRAAQQSFNFGMVIVGALLTGTVGYFLYQEVFSPDSKVAYFNRAVDRIRKDPRCVELLGDGKKITAFGEETGNKWRRARPISSTSKLDPQGNEHLLIHFNVEGPKNKGSVDMHLIRRKDASDFEYQYFFVDVRGHERLYLERATGGAGKKGEGKVRMFGINFG